MSDWDLQRNWKVNVASYVFLNMKYFREYRKMVVDGRMLEQMTEVLS